MTKSMITLVLLVVTLTANIALSEEIHPETLSKLILLSGLDKQIAEFPGMILSGVDQNRQQSPAISDAAFDELGNSIRRAFDPSKFIETISAEVKKSISESEAQSLLAWYESDPGKVITTAEEAASKPGAFEEMTGEADILLADQQRVDIANQLDDLLSVTDKMMEIQESAGVAVFTAVSKALDPDSPIDTSEYRRQMSAHSDQIYGPLKQLTILSFVYSYKNIDIDILNQYVSFNRKPYARQFNDSVIKGIGNAFSKSIEKMVTSITVALKKQAEQ